MDAGKIYKAVSAASKVIKSEAKDFRKLSGKMFVHNFEPIDFSKVDIKNLSVDKTKLTQIIEQESKEFNKTLASFKKSAGVESILETKPQTFHGINPSVKIGDNTVILPKFISEEMQTARKMNQIARQQIIKPIDRTFSKATPSDLKRLTSDALEDSYSRVAYTKPETGEVFHLLKEGETKDGKVIVRILDKDGAFIKNAELESKRIVVMDDFIPNKPINDIVYENCSHGNLVGRVLKRYNPFAKIELVDVTSSHNISLEGRFILEIAKRMPQGKIDYLSSSYGGVVKSKDFPIKLEESKLFQNYGLGDYLEKLLGTRYLFSAGNSQNSAVFRHLLQKNTEGVGALGLDGKIAEFSFRNPLMAQHYEQGVLPLKPTRFGLSFTDDCTTDIKIMPECYPLVEKYIGKNFNIATEEFRARVSNLRHRVYSKFGQVLEEMNSKIITKQELERLENLKKNFYNQKMFSQQFISAQNMYVRYKTALSNKVKFKLKDFDCRERAEYKNLLEYAEKETIVGKERANRGEFYRTLPPDPFDNAAHKSGMLFTIDKDKKLVLPYYYMNYLIKGTSFAQPIRTAKLALNDMMKGIV